LISAIKDTGNAQKIKSQVFLTLYIKQGFRELIKSAILVLREEKINMQIKYTIFKHITRVKIILEYHLEYVNMKHLETKILEIVQYMEQILELKQEYIYEKNLRSKCVVVYAMLNERGKVDSDLQAIEVGDGSNMTYISFRNLSSENKLVGL
jgi:hypothetical protein